MTLRSIVFPLTIPARDPAADAQRMARLSGGDQTALDELIESHWAGLAEYAARLLDDVDAGKGVAQEVFVRLWQQRASWKPNRPLVVYLFRIARNLAIDERRKQSVRAKWAATQQGLPRPASPTPADVFAGEELRAAITRAVLQLPARRREVFILAHFNGLSYHEIARIMGTSPQTAANQLAMAISDLLRMLELS